MRSGSWSQGPVREVSASVAGLLMTAGEVEVSRELPSPLPGQSSGLGGFAAATGQVSATSESGVASRVGTAWTRANWPSGNDPVLVDVTDGSNRHRLLTGKVDGSSSSLADIGVSVPLVDGTDALSRTGTWLSVWNVMPPRLKDDDNGQNRITGACGAWAVDRHARWAGFYMTPRRTPYTVISAPLSGCTWPEWGDLHLSRHADDPNAWARTRPRPIYAFDRVYTSTFDASWVANSGSPWTQGITSGRPLDITAGFRSGSSGSAHVSCHWADFTIRMACTSSGLVYAQYIRDGATSSVAVLSQSQMLGSRFVTLRVSNESGWTYRFTLTNDRGETATGSTSIDGGVPAYAQWDSVRAYAPEGAGITGLLVSYDGASTRPPAQGFAPNFQFRPDTIQPLDVIPSMTNVSSAEVIQGQAEAENAAVWIDEDGALQWRGHEVLRAQEVARTFVSKDLADAQIEVDAQDVRRTVAATYQRWAVSVARKAKFLLYEGSTDELEDGDAKETFIEPDDDVEWAQPHLLPWSLYGENGAAQFNSGRDSYVGYTALTKAGDELIGAGTAGSVKFDLERVEGNKLKFTARCQATPTDAVRVKLASKNDSNVIKKAYQGVGLPLIRGMGIANAMEATYSRSLGPAGAPDLKVDLGWHVQDPAEVKARVNWVAAELATPKARLEGIRLLPDPRVQLGDKITIEDSAVTGLRVTGILSLVKNTVRAGEHEMTIGLRILEVTAPHVTLAEFDAFYSGMSLAAVDRLFAGQSLDQVDRDPLQR